MSAPSSNASDQSEEDTDEALDFAQSRGDRSANEASEGPSWARLTPPSPAPVHIRSATSLGPDYQGPGPLDVICGRGKRALRHPGNIALRRRIETKLEEYTQASTKIEKSVIVSSILDGVRDDSPGGGFVRFEKGEWFEVGDHFAREKIGQSFRDMLHTKYKSSTKAKGQRRKVQQMFNESHVASMPDESSHLLHLMRQPVGPVMSQDGPLDQYEDSKPAAQSTSQNEPRNAYGSSAEDHFDPALLESPKGFRYGNPLNHDDVQNSVELSPSSEYHNAFGESYDGQPTAALPTEQTSLVSLLCPATGGGSLHVNSDVRYELKHSSSEGTTGSNSHTAGNK